MKKQVLKIFLVLAILTGGVCYFILKYNYSTGVRSGKLVKLSKKGFLFKSYEGILDLGSGDKLTWEFSVRDTNLGSKLTPMAGEYIKLNYDEKLLKLMYSSKYNVTSFEKVSQGDEGLCRLVNIMRASGNETVLAVKKMIEMKDPTLLEKIRSCPK